MEGGMPRVVDEDVDVAGALERAVNRIGITDVERERRSARADFDSRCGRTFGHQVVDEDVSACGPRVCATRRPTPRPAPVTRAWRPVRSNTTFLLARLAKSPQHTHLQ